jgi:acetyl-CoA carboxylase biotin carboxyl carrier protein
VSEQAIVAVKAQMSGVFYRSAAPDQPPFVEPGARVRKGQTIALLESMKLFSNVKAPTDGVVVEICAANEEAVGVGQVLVRLQRA